MSNPSFMDWLEDLRAVPDFQASVAPSDKQSDEQYDLELVVRFLVLASRSEESLSQFRDLRELLTGSILEYAESDDFPQVEHAVRFTGTFELLNAALNGSAFRRYDIETDRFLGGFSVSAFEVVSVGVASNLARVGATRITQARVGSVGRTRSSAVLGWRINPSTRIRAGRIGATSSQLRARGSERSCASSPMGA